jgi:hypothetical protein
VVDEDDVEALLAANDERDASEESMEAELEVGDNGGERADGVAGAAAVETGGNARGDERGEFESHSLV